MKHFHITLRLRGMLKPSSRYTVQCNSAKIIAFDGVQSGAKLLNQRLVLVLKCTLPPPTSHFQRVGGIQALYKRNDALLENDSYVFTISCYKQTVVICDSNEVTEETT